MNKRYQFDRIFLSKKTNIQGGISYVFNYTKEFTDVLGKELFSEIVTQIENFIFDDLKRKKQYEAVRFAEKSLITKNGKARFERRFYKDNETGEYIYLTDKVLGMEKLYKY